MARIPRTHLFDRLQSGAPGDPEHPFPRGWAKDAENELLHAIWNGWDEARANKILPAGGILESDLQKELTISDILVPYIARQLNSKGSSFYLRPESPEFKSAHSPRAQPPSLDLSFRTTVDLRLSWPIEAKIIENSSNVEKYCNEIRSNFMSGRYSRFANSGAMLGYLLRGKSSDAFSTIQKNLGTKLNIDDRFVDRDHRYSKHKRTINENQDTISCHHLILLVGSENFNKQK